MPLRPLLRRKDCEKDQTVDIRLCAYRSWCAVGLTPKSINTDFELRGVGLADGDRFQFEDSSSLSLIAVDSTVDIEAPAYLPNLEGMIRGILSGTCVGERVMLINADIVLHPEFLLSEVSGARSCSCSDFWIGRRLDVPALSNVIELTHVSLSELSREATYEHGIDAIVVSRELLEKAIGFLPSGLTFGMPWWDLVLPVALIKAGGNLRQMPSSSLIHVNHEQRSWGVSRWRSVGSNVVAVLEMYKGNSNDESLCVFGQILEGAKSVCMRPSIIKTSFLYKLKTLAFFGSRGPKGSSVSYLLALAYVMEELLKG